MSLDTEHWVDALLDAEARRQPMAPISDTVTDLTVADGYGIQAALLERRVARGERIVGAKLGLTSRAKQQQMGVTEPTFGWLTEAMVLAADGTVPVDQLIHPRVEPEIAFVLDHELGGRRATVHDVLAASHVCCALEVIDSRYADFRFTLADVVADNTSAARFALGPRRVPTDGIDLSLIGCLLEVDGEPVATAAGAEVLGHPAAAVALLVNELAERGTTFPAGSIILSGGLTAAVALGADRHVTATWGRLGSLTVFGG